MNEPPKTSGAIFSRMWDKAWLLLVLTMLIWGANAPVVKLAAGEISPMTIVMMRWALVGVAVMVFRPPSFRQDWQQAKKRPWFMLAMAMLMTVSNAMIFIGAQYTTGINLSILQGAGPVLVMFGAWAWFGTRIGPVRLLGLIVSTIGVLLLATQGNLLMLGTVQLNIGDVMMLMSVLCYTVYILALRYRPEMPNYSYYCFIAVFSLLISIPMLGAEMALGRTFMPSWQGLLALLYVAFLTSMIGQIFFMRAVELVGPGRASQFQNLAPLIGSVTSAVVLGEQFALHHILALILVTGGILIAERYGAR
jgi:drug/metabolite transporter (DMT)-like permease